MRPEKKICFWTGAQQIFSSGLSFYLRHLYFPQMGHDHHTCCHTVRASSSMWNSGIGVGPAATVAPANSPISSSSSCFLSLTHTCPFKWIPALILILLFHLFLSFPCSVFFLVFPCTATPPPTSAHSGQHATVRAPTITSADTLMLKLCCLSLTINDQQPVYLCQGQEKKLTSAGTHIPLLCPHLMMSAVDCEGWCSVWLSDCESPQ